MAALVSLKIKHLDIVEKSIKQKPREVATKFSKNIDTFFAKGFDEAEDVPSIWIVHLDEKEFCGPDNPLFASTANRAHGNMGFKAIGYERRHWRTTEPVCKIVDTAFANVGIQAYGPHTFRRMLARHAAPTANRLQS